MLSVLGSRFSVHNRATVMMMTTACSRQQTDPRYPNCPSQTLRHSNLTHCNTCRRLLLATKPVGNRIHIPVDTEETRFGGEGRRQSKLDRNPSQVFEICQMLVPFTCRCHFAKEFEFNSSKTIPMTISRIKYTKFLVTRTPKNSRSENCQSSCVRCTTQKRQTILATPKLSECPTWSTKLWRSPGSKVPTSENNVCWSEK